MKKLSIYFLLLILIAGCDAELRQINETGDCSGCDLSKLDYGQLTNTENLFLANSTSTDGVIADVELVAANFSNSTFKNMTFNNVTFSGGDFSDAKFINSTFNGVNFTSDADLSNTYIQGKGSDLYFSGISTDRLKVVGDLDVLGFSDVRGQRGKISGDTKNLAIDGSFFTGQLDSGMLLNFTQSEPLNINKVYADYTQKYRAARAKVGEADARYYDMGLLQGGVMRNETFLPLRYQKIERDGPYNLSDVFDEGEYYFEETREARSAIEGSLSENAKIWIEQFSAGTDEAYEKELAMDALNRSGVLVCQEPDLLYGQRFPRPRDLQRNAYTEAWVINQNNNFDSLRELADNYADCVNAGADAFEAMLAERSSGLDELNRLFRAYKDNELEKAQKEYQRRRIVKEAYEEKVLSFIKDYYKNDELDATYLQTVAMVRVNSMSQKDQAKLMMSNNGVGGLVNGIKAEIYDKWVSCSNRDFSLAILRSKDPNYPESKEAKFNLALLKLLIATKNEQYEISEADIRKLMQLGFSENETAVKVENIVSRFKNCTFDVMADM